VNDPWITEKKAKQILALYPEADYIPLKAGHCPHDEKPADFNAGLEQWLAATKL
jgi:pimeloyl-ACP methyl ester carboxylesterase